MEYFGHPWYFGVNPDWPSPISSNTVAAVGSQVSIDHQEDLPYAPLSEEIYMWFIGPGRDPSTGMPESGISLTPLACNGDICSLTTPKEIMYCPSLIGIRPDQCSMTPDTKIPLPPSLLYWGPRITVTRN